MALKSTKGEWSNGQIHIYIYLSRSSDFAMRQMIVGSITTVAATVMQLFLLKKSIFFCGLFSYAL